MENVSTIFTEDVNKKSYSYSDYISLIESVVDAGKTTGLTQSEELSHYTKLNLSRSKRIYKTTILSPEMVSKVKAITEKQTWYVITEGWCGDAAQSVPILALVADENPLIDFKLILRDENLEIMDLYLTNGGRSIPKLISVDENLNELFSWGPRPENAQKLFEIYKLNPTKEHKEFAEDMQRWYIQDKAISIQEELGELIQSV